VLAEVLMVGYGIEGWRVEFGEGGVGWVKRLVPHTPKTCLNVKPKGSPITYYIDSEDILETRQS